ncbi:MAG: pitrilysin family protein [Gammaproteobacteria bacterium]|jgi:zinc protease
MFARRFLCLLALLVLVAPAQAAPEIHSWSTRNGAKVMYVAAPAIPMLDVRVVFNAGSARDGSLPGIALMTSNLLNDGAGTLSADQLAEAFESLGAQFSTSSLKDMAIVTLRTLSDEEVMRQSLDLLELVLTQPEFAADEIERRRLQMQVALEKQQESPSDTASITFYKTLYGDHPYAHNPSGDETGIAAITRDDIQAFFKRYYVARNAVIAIVGDVDRAQAEAIAEQLSRGMPAGEKAPPLPEVVVPGEGENIAVSFPSSQTHILMGQPVMARGDDDFFPLYVGNHMLGGSGLVSMLGDEVREKRGLAYSVYSYFSLMQNKGPYIFGAQTRNDRAQETLDVIRETLERFIENGPTDERLTASKKNITGGFPLRTASNSNIVEYIAMMGFYDYPLDYLDTFVARVNAVTAEDIRDAFRKRVNPDDFLVVTVGKNGKDKE